MQRKIVPGIARRTKRNNNAIYANFASSLRSPDRAL
jgi:hypothetical protein